MREGGGVALLVGHEEHVAQEKDAGQDPLDDEGQQGAGGLVERALAPSGLTLRSHLSPPHRKTKSLDF